MTYQSIENKGYEGVIKLQGLTGTAGTHNVKVEAFGKTVVNEVNIDIDDLTEFVFAFYNFDTTGNNQVIITITTDLAESYTT